MSGEDSSREVEARSVTIKLVDGSFVKGKINLKKRKDENIIQRESDMFTRHKDPFVVLFGATGGDITGQVVIVNKRNILWVSPDD